MPLIGVFNEEQAASSLVVDEITRGGNYYLVCVGSAFPAWDLSYMLTGWGFAFGVEIRNIVVATISKARTKHPQFGHVLGMLDTLDLVLKAMYLYGSIH